MAEHVYHIYPRTKTKALTNIEEKIALLPEDHQLYTEQNVGAVLQAIYEAMQNYDSFIVPVTLPAEAMAELEQEGYADGVVVTDVKNYYNVSFKVVPTKDGKSNFVAFTDQEQLAKGEPVSTVTMKITSLLYTAMNNNDFHGIMINPWGKTFFLAKPYIEYIFENLNNNK